MASVGSVVGIAVTLLFAPAPEPDVSLGVGWTVAQINAALDAPPGPKPPPPPGTRHDEQGASAAADAQAQAGDPASASPEPGNNAVSPPAPRVSVRPYAHHSDLDARIKEARRARALQIGAALAVQGAMVIYGITRAIDNAKEAEILRDEPAPSQYKPMYPR